MHFSTTFLVAFSALAVAQQSSQAVVKTRETLIAVRICMLTDPLYRITLLPATSPKPTVTEQSPANLSLPPRKKPPQPPSSPLPLSRPVVQPASFPPRRASPRPWPPRLKSPTMHLPAALRHPSPRQSSLLTDLHPQMTWTLRPPTWALPVLLPSKLLVLLV